MSEFSLPVRLQGIHASPYTRKAVGALRYRRIPYRFILGQPGLLADSGHVDTESLPIAKPPLLPTFYTQDEVGNDQAVTDSTPILEQLDRQFSERSVHPSSPALNFINYLLEDYADEWLTRCMFHFRWAFDADIDKAGTLIPYLTSPSIPEAMAKAFKGEFVKRQIGRLSFVGSNSVTAPVIEASYIRFLQLMDAHLARHSFLMGARPGSCDFAAFGQLTCLTHFDPTPMALAVKHGPRTYGWTERVEDLCGYEVEEGDWLNPHELPDTLMALLKEVARTHMPQLLANAKALQAGEKNFETEIDGLPWTQPSFPYQGKCLLWIRERYNKLTGNDQTVVQDTLVTAGLLSLIEG